MSDDTTPPEPLSVEDAKAHLRVTNTAEDALIIALIVAAREYVEDFTGLVLTARSITETAQCLGRWIDLDSWPIASVDAIRYPVNGVMTALTAGSWRVSLLKRPVRILPASWGWGISSFSPLGFLTRTVDLPVEIDVTAGFATPDDVPQSVKQAMLLLIQSWYDNRSAVEAGLRAAAIEVPFTVNVLLRKHRLATI